MYVERLSQDYIRFVKGMKIYPEANTVKGAHGYSLLALSEEVGELHGKIAKSYRDKKPYSLEEVSLELGDIYFQLTALCTDLDLDPNEVLDKNVKKLIDRKERGKLEGSGDKR